MKFADDKAVTVGGYKFEHARIVQGLIIYIVFILLAGMGIAAGEKNAFFIPVVIILIYGFNLFIYAAKKTKTKRVFSPALLATICMPTSMVG